MQRKLLFILLIVFAVNAFSQELTITSPEEGQVFALGDEIVVEYSSDLYFKYVLLTGYINNQYISIAFEIFAPPNTVNHGKFTVDSTGFPVGSGYLRVMGFYTPEGENVSGNLNSLVHVVFNETPGLLDENAPVNVIRVLSDKAYAGAVQYTGFLIIPNQELSGIVIKDTLGVGLTPNSVAGYGMHGAVYDYIAEGDTFKIVGRNADGIGYNPATDMFELAQVNYGSYVSDDAVPGIDIYFNGTWETDDANGVIIGDNVIQIGGFSLPDCPVTDSQLLDFITQWAGEDIDDEQLLQVIERWRTCED